MEISRSRTADFIKGLALLTMVQMVLVEYFAKPVIVNSLVGKISMFLGGPPAAPVFLAVMGYYIAHNAKSFMENIKRGIRLIALGLLVNIGRNALVLFHLTKVTAQTDTMHLLFGSDILILAGISLITMAVIIKLLKGHVLLYLSLIIIFLLLQYVVPPVEKIYPHSLFIPLIYGKYPGSFFPFIPWFAYVLAGYSFYLFKQYFVSDQFKHSQTVKIILLSLSGLMLIGSIPFGFGVTIRPILFYHHGILFFMFCINYMFWWLLSAHAIVNRVNNRVTHYLEYIGKNVTVFYIIFMILAGNLALWLHGNLNYIQLTFWFIGLLIVTSLLVWLWDSVGKNKIAV